MFHIVLPVFFVKEEYLVLQNTHADARTHLTDCRIRARRDVEEKEWAREVERNAKAAAASGSGRRGCWVPL